MKRFGCLGLSLFFILIGAVIAYRFLNPPRVGGTPLAQLPASEQQKRRADARNLVAEVDSVAKANQRGESKSYTITATADQLNTLLQDNLQMKNLPVSNLRLGLQPGQIVLQGDTDYKGFQAPATVTGTLTPRDDGGVKFDVLSLEVGSFPAPDKWKDKIRKPVERQLDKMFRHGNGGRIQSIVIEQDRMTVQGVTR